MSSALERLLKRLAWVAGIVLLVALYFSNNIVGYYRFKEICEKEAGLRVYESLQRNEGWQTSTHIPISTAEYLLTYYEGVEFVRYVGDKKGFRDLVRTNEKKDRWDSGFRSIAIQENKLPKYEFVYEIVEDERVPRMNRHTSSVTNIQSGRLAVVYSDFAYRLFSSDWGLGRGTACSSFDRDDLGKNPNNSREIAIGKAFNR